MDNDDLARRTLERLMRERGEDYASLSRFIGRNAAYMQQFMKRGTPRRLKEEDRSKLARYFRVDEQLLGGPAPVATSDVETKLIKVERHDVDVSAGHGGDGDEGPRKLLFGFEESWLRGVCRGGIDQLSMVRVQGDSMDPTLGDGDDILVDASESARSIRDGIYVLRRDDALVVKRLAVNPETQRITVKSDNTVYPSWPDLKPESLRILGRVVWAGRRM